MSNLPALRAGRVRLAASVALYALAATGALAQTATPYRYLDSNGVDLVYGNNVFRFEEGSIGTGEDRLVLARNSLAKAASEWDNFRLGRDTGGNNAAVTITTWYNSTRWTRNATTGIYSNGLADGATLVRGSNSYTLTNPDGSTVTFALPSGDAINSINVCYDGNTRACTLDAVQFKDPNGRTTNIAYDVFIQRGPEFDPVRDDYVERAWWRIAQVTRSTSSYITFQYQTNDLPFGIGQTPSTQWSTRSGATFGANLATVGYTYPTAGSVTVRDPLGNDWQLTGSSGNITVRPPGASVDWFALTYGTGGSITVQRNGVTTSYSRSVSGSTATMTVTHAPGQQTVVVSNLTIGRPTQVTDPLGRVTKYTYDTSGRLTKIERPEGQTTEYTFDTRGNITRTRQVAKPGSSEPAIDLDAGYPASCTNPVTCNQPSWTKDARGNQTDYTYDSVHGGVLTVTAPLPTPTSMVRPQTRYSYTTVDGVAVVNGISRCRTTASCAGTSDETLTAVTYNTARQPTGLTVRAGDNSLSSSVAMGYDARGNLTSVDGPLSGTGDVTLYRYDAARHLVGSIEPNPTGATPGQRRAQRTVWRTDGLIDRSEAGTVNGPSDTDWAAFVPLQWQARGYDSYGRQTSAQLKDPSTTFSLTQNSYDGRGRVECTVVRMNPAAFGTAPGACTLGTSGSFGADRITRNSYNAANELTKVEVAVGTADAADDMTITYTANGSRQTIGDANNNLTTYEYDGHGRLAKTRFPSKTTPGVSATNDFEQWTYTADSQTATWQRRSGATLAYEYDALGRLTKKTPPSPAAAVFYSYDNVGQMLRASEGSAVGTPASIFTYDALGRVSSSGTADGGFAATLTYAYDAAGRRTAMTFPDSVSFGYAWDLTNRMTALQEGTTGVVGYSYDALGQRSGISRSNGTSTAYGYDGASRLTSLTHDLAGTADDLTINYGQYNPAGQIGERELSNDSYAWTGHGNVDRPYTINGLNQSTAAGGTTISWDSNGNLSSDGAATYGYDSENRLTSSVQSGTTYGLKQDPLGRLLRSETGGSATLRYLYDGNDLVAEYDAAGTLLRRYLHGPGDDEPMVRYGSSGSAGRTYLYADDLGSVVTTAGDSGAAAGRGRYDEYGRAQMSAEIGRFGYTGQVLLPDIGQNWYKARVYHPGLGRFLQTDPVGYDAGMNLYAYVGGDPVNARDPTGLLRDYYQYVKPKDPAPAAGGDDPPCPGPYCPTATRIGSTPVGFPGVGSENGSRSSGQRGEGAERGGADGSSSCPVRNDVTTDDKVGGLALGILDSLSFDLYGDTLSDLGFGDQISRERSADSYEAGKTLGLVVGVARLAYAGIAKSLARFDGRTASAARNELKGLFSGLGKNHPRIKSYESLLARYGSDRAVAQAASRTDPALNTAAAAMVGSNVTGGVSCPQ